MSFISRLSLAVVLLGSTIEAQNVLLITIESARQDRFGSYGSAGATPNLDSWARTGTVFSNAYSVSSWTAPAIVSTMTGLYPPGHGVNSRDEMGSPDIPALPGILRKAGYRTSNLSSIGDQPYYSNLGFTQPSERPEEDVLIWLGRESRSKSRKPFFAWYHDSTMGPPYKGVDEGARADVPFSSPGMRALLRGSLLPAGAVVFSLDEKPVLERLYDDELRGLDHRFGQILRILKKRKILKETLIIVVGTHGMELLDHGYVGDASTSLNAKLYEELIRVPLIISWPRKIPGGRHLDQPVSQIDILPTVLNLLNLPPLETSHGLDLIREVPDDRSLFFESVHSGSQTIREDEELWLRGMIRKGFKYLSSEELYNLEFDPEEKDNLIEQEADMASGFRSDVAHWLASCRSDQQQLAPYGTRVYSSQEEDGCPRIIQPSSLRLDYDQYTGAVIFNWTGTKNQTYRVQFTLGSEDRRNGGLIEVEGNHHVLGPFGQEIWKGLRAWNPLRIRVSARSPRPCWSEWAEFHVDSIEPAPSP